MSDTKDARSVEMDTAEEDETIQHGKDESTTSTTNTTTSVDVSRPYDWINSFTISETRMALKFVRNLASVQCSDRWPLNPERTAGELATAFLVRHLLQNPSIPFKSS